MTQPIRIDGNAGARFPPDLPRKHIFLAHVAKQPHALSTFALSFTQPISHDQHTTMADQATSNAPAADEFKGKGKAAPEKSSFGAMDVDEESEESEPEAAVSTASIRGISCLLML